MAGQSKQKTGYENHEARVCYYNNLGIPPNKPEEICHKTRTKADV